MCGRFAQAQAREEHLTYLADEAERDMAYDQIQLAGITSSLARKYSCLVGATSKYIWIL